MPNFTYFKPAGVRIIDLNENILTIGEFEAIRLKDLENLEQKECANRMDLSQPTFHRLLMSARKKIADCIANGKAIKIEGGEYVMAPQIRGKGRGRGGGFARGPGGECYCPNCEYRETHQLGVPCYSKKCPKCGTPMTRA